MACNPAVVSFLTNITKAAAGLGAATSLLSPSLYTVDGSEHTVIFDRFLGCLSETVSEGTPLPHAVAPEPLHLRYPHDLQKVDHLHLPRPQGRMELFRTHVYPMNKYLTLQMMSSAKGMVCEDIFKSPDAADCDFRGGAGATIDEATRNKPGKEIAEPRSPKFESDGDGDASEDSDHIDENSTQNMSEAPSVRHRTAGKL
ncbi:uncharacterized protein LOC133892286 [Phragmites australis]|uniref:uncharacterized protein LOC133892286 n=1 Tax=Phragmites australis TaxID=29695 RepID=UPI002D77DA9A|nr:uncharacterized protein LOC133892286 [Phragmites australis]